MNKAFRIIWSHSRQAFVVTDELASTSSKRSCARLLLAAASAGLLLASQAGVAQAANVCSSGTNTISSPAALGDTCELASGASLNVVVGGSIRSLGGDSTVANEEGVTEVGTITNGGAIDSDSIGIRLGSITPGLQGNSVAIINQAGAVIESGSSGIYIGEWTLGSLTNAGSIVFGTYGIYVDGSINGDLRNETGAAIESLQSAIHINSNIGGSIVNAGIIRSSRAYAVSIRNIAGKVLNEAGGRIEGELAGILLLDGGMGGDIVNAGHISASNGDAINIEGDIAGNLRNEAGGRIEGTSVGIWLSEGEMSGDIVNAGHISASNGQAINIQRKIAGNLRNEAGGRIEGISAGISLLESEVGGDIANAGHISASNGHAIIILGNIAGNLRNEADGRIEGTFGGILFFQHEVGGDIVNAGHIRASNGRGMNILGKIAGNLRNEADGRIEGTLAGIWLSDGEVRGDIVNAGHISAGNGSAIDIQRSIVGNLRNEAGGRIEGGGDGILLFQSVVGGDIVNAGNITSDTNLNSRAIIVDNSRVGGKLENSGVIRTIAKGLSLSMSAVTGNVVNSGSIVGHSDSPSGDSGDDGISLYASQIGGSLINSGTIDANDDGIGLKEKNGVRSTITGDLINTAGAMLSAEYDGLHLEDSDVRGVIRNQGTIIGRKSHGIEIGGLNAQGMLLGGITQGAQTGVRLRESVLADGIAITGNVEGGVYAIQIDSLSQADIYIGIGAQIIGDVAATNAAVNVRAGNTFNNLNAFRVKNFGIENGATLNMAAGTSTSGGPADSGILDGFTVSHGFVNNGTLALASGVTGSIHGDYSQGTNGTLKIGVASDTAYGKLVVNGTAELASNAKIAVDVSNPNYRFSVASLQDVLSATSLNSDGTFAVSDNSRLFDFGAVKDGNTVDLAISATASIEDIVIGLGNTPAEGAAKVLDQVIGDNPSGELAGHFVGLITEQQVSDAVSSTLPTVAGSSGNAIGDTLSGVNRVVQARQASNSGLSSGDAVAEDNLWIKTFGAWAEQDERSAISGYDANTQGLVIGVDAVVSEHSRLGLAFAYAQTNLDSDSHVAPQSADIDTFQLIGYGSHALDANTELNFQLDGGQNRVSSTRHMPFASTTAKADYDGYNLHAGVGIGHSLRLSEQLTFIPSARADYTWIESEAYREKGAGALNLNVESNDAEELRLSVDGKLDYQLSAATVASVNLGAGYDVIDADSAIASTYAGAPGATFKTMGMDLEPWMARAGLGLSHTLPSGTEVSLRYDAEVRSGFTSQGASLKARWAF